MSRLILCLFIAGMIVSLTIAEYLVCNGYAPVVRHLYHDETVKLVGTLGSSARHLCLALSVLCAARALRKLPGAPVAAFKPLSQAAAVFGLAFALPVLLNGLVGDSPLDANAFEHTRLEALSPDSVLH